LLMSIISAPVFAAIILALVCFPTPGLPVMTNFNLNDISDRLFIRGLPNEAMRTCESCGRVRFYSLNFLFSKTICNECYLKMKEKKNNS